MQKNAIDILIEVVLNLYFMFLGSMGMLAILVLAIHHHGISSHLFASSMSFVNV
jgi:hypothetical protein